MDLVSLRRQHISWVIQQNPTQVTINRTEKVPQDGGFAEVTSTKGPFTVRIFPAGSRSPGLVSDLPGRKLEDDTWGLLADYTADIQAGPNVVDEFDAPGLGHFRVTAVYPQVVQGQLVGYQADLKKVS
ncbi:MAG: hypothetical protein HPY58_13520 [Firmicutes bacterium]|nr:hypothetical protein [Bacillota bacterium]